MIHILTFKYSYREKVSNQNFAINILPFDITLFYRTMYVVSRPICIAC